MAKGQPKKKKANSNVFTVYFHSDGVFAKWPLEYCDGNTKVINDTNFAKMSFENLKEISRKLSLNVFDKFFYCKRGLDLGLGLREIKSTQDIGEMLKVGYESGNEIDVYVEHFGYDIMETVRLHQNEEQNQGNIEDSDDECYGSDDYEEIENVDFYTEGDENVVIRSIGTHDPFLTKLCTARNLFRGSDAYVHNEAPRVDPDDHHIQSVNKVQNHVEYPAFNPNIPWDKMEPILGMRYETPYQLKLALANYGVAHGYQLWFMKSDWRELLVYCGRNVDEGRCAGKKGNKDRVMKNKDKDRSGVQTVVMKKIVKKKVSKMRKKGGNAGEGSSGSPKLTKKLIRERKERIVCPFRLYASWMSKEHSFQIKSLISEHKCTRNYSMGSLVTFRWIALQFFKEIIEDPFIALRKMRAAIRQKFMIDVSIGQCKRAKQLALFDHEGGLIEHYGKLYQYRQALLDSNPGSTCMLEVDESSTGPPTFKRMYICFKGVKDGWMLGCRRVIGLDGCFLKHTCRGELLTAMGRDANNQMYPIAWAVVRVENSANWSWFIGLLHDDLNLSQGVGITIISDSHKGLIDAVSDWLPEAEHRKCTRHIYANFKKKYSGLLYQRLFWAAASCSLEPVFLEIMDQIKQLDQGAYDYLEGGERQYYHQRGRSERIANMKLNKPFPFDKYGTGKTPDKAFDVSD